MTHNTLLARVRGGDRMRNTCNTLNHYGLTLFRQPKQLVERCLELLEITIDVSHGWNDFIKDFYAESREAFKAWKDSGCPRFGPVACYMRSSRANFKYVLRQSKLYEEDIRAMALSNKLQGGEIVPYWREIQSLSGSKRTCLPGRVDDAVGGETISSLWERKVYLCTKFG